MKAAGIGQMPQREQRGRSSSGDSNMTPNLRQRSPRLKTREKALGSSSRRSSSGVPGINRDAVAPAREPGLAPTFETARMQYRCGQAITARARVRCHQLRVQTVDAAFLETAGAIAMTGADLCDVYRRYIACLNRQDWAKLEQFVDDDVHYNGRRIGLSDYRKMLERDFCEIPDLHFNIQLLISDPPSIASRLVFDCTPKGKFLGLDVNGRRVSFGENVFYEFRREKIAQVWSVIDKGAIEAQLLPA
jgi:predicted ester cyclase